MPDFFVNFQVMINIVDINDNLAEFEHTSLNLTLPEHSPNGLEVIKVNATDKDKVTIIAKVAGVLVS